MDEVKSEDNLEIEVKFLEIDVPAIKTKLASLGAEDLGEDLLKEIIFYDKDLEWQKERTQRVRFVRLRSNKKGVLLTYKSKLGGTQPYAEEIEVMVSDLDKATQLLEAVGLVVFRHQEKRRHSYLLNDTMIEIDTWPRVPPYLEIEGPSEELVKQVAEQLGFDWNEGVFEVAGRVIEKHYNIPVGDYQYFTFDKVE